MDWLCTANAKSGFGDKPWTSYDMLVVRVETDDGIVGWGESWGYGIIPATKAAIEHVVAPHFIGRDPTRFGDLEEIRHKLHLFGRNGAVNYALAGIEIALWDIWGKNVDKPLHAVVGGAHRLEFPAYASLVPYRDPALVARMTTKALAEGYSTVKLHEIEIPSVHAAREAGGDRFELMLDTNCPWTPWQAQEMARRLQEFRLYWLEEPVWPPENFPALAQLKRESGLAIAAGENVGTAREFETLLAHDAVTYAQPSVTKIGGIAETRKVFGLAETHNIPVSPHSPYLGPGMAATLQLAATLRCPVMIERVYIQIEASPFGSMIDVRSGSMRVPDGPGLGIEPDRELIKRYRAAG